jgi:hypothetical protein
MKWTAGNRQTWIVAGLMAFLALGLAPTSAVAERDQDQVQTPAGEVYGVVKSLPGTPNRVGDWTIDGRTVRVEASTRIEQEHGQPEVGASVEVKGQPQPDGSLKATKIELKRRANRS